MNKITHSSRLKEVYNTPVGRDLIDKLLLSIGKSSKTIDNPLIGNIKLSTLCRLGGKIIKEETVDSLTGLINSEADEPLTCKAPVEKAWWKEAVFYQVYPRSFYDTNGDGIGDLKGITAKLDYLKDLGVDALWLSPIYDSPNDDNGYDIRDYRKIMTEFGTMEDFDELLAGVHSRNMRLIMDLVVNHTSDEHEWFKKALSGDEKYQKYYIFRDGDPDKEPNNWRSFFAGTAWNYYPDLQKWGLHLFSKKQMDLNWENEEVRQEVADMVNWWLDKGVDGFRMDVINCISKEEGLPDGDEIIGDMVGVRGIEHYFYGPKLHEYLRELQQRSFDPHRAFSVGETPGLGMEMAKLISAEGRDELNMIFSFDHLECPGHVRMEDYEYDLNYYRDYIIKWMMEYGNNCRMSLFYNNHDNPRMASKISGDASMHEAIQILLAVMQFTLKGTPFIYQGDEMGLVNYDFTSMDDITDVEAKGFYGEMSLKVGEKKAFETIVAGTREHARILLPWNEDAKNRSKLVASQKINKNITDVYKTLISLRRSHDTLIYGEFEPICTKKDRFVYKRVGEEEYLIDCNIGSREKSSYKVSGYSLIFPLDVRDFSKLGPYEARIYKKL